MFVNTQLFSPVIMDGLCQAHPKSYEYRQWWTEQKRRCIEGYSVGDVRITGDYYWYLNFWKIKGRDTKSQRKTLIAPRFLDIDYEFFTKFEEARKAGKNFVVAKARQKGFSEKISGLIGKEFSLFSHSQSVIAAGEEKYSNNTTRMVIRGLNSLKETEFYKRRSPDKLDYIQGKYKVIEDGVPTWKGSYSEVYNITCKNNPQATVGLTPSLILFEEAGRFEGLIDAYKYILPALEAEGQKTGIAVIVGTGGDMDKGAANLEEMFYNPDAYDVMAYNNEYDDDAAYDERVAYFVPAWKFELIDDNGNSKKEDSIKKIESAREEARKSNKLDAYITEVTQKPIIPKEAFMRTGGNAFNIAKLNMQLAHIKSHKEILKGVDVGDLVWDKNENGHNVGVTFRHNPKGSFIIMEHPEEDDTGEVFLNLYLAGTDSYDKDEANSSDSKGSCSIFKTFRDINRTSNLFVARYTERPATAKEFYENTAKLCMYYKSMNLIEWSNIGIFEWYIQNGFEGYLKERPHVAYASIKNSKVSNRYGVDPSTKTYWIEAYGDYIEHNTEKMFDPEQVERAIKFRNEKTYNCDLTISSSLCIVHSVDNYDIKVRKEKVTKAEDEFFGYKSNKGGFALTG